MMIYSPEGRPVVVDLCKLSGSSVNAWWYDPRTGEANRIEFSADQRQRFVPPFSGRRNDWVLVLDDARVRRARSHRGCRD